MTSRVVTCAACAQRFVCDAKRISAQPACSAGCLSEIYRRRIRRRRLVAWSQGPTTSQTTPNRIALALAETRDAVEQLQAEGRRLHLEHQETS